MNWYIREKLVSLFFATHPARGGDNAEIQIAIVIGKKLNDDFGVASRLTPRKSSRAPASPFEFFQIARMPSSINIPIVNANVDADAFDRILDRSTYEISLHSGINRRWGIKLPLRLVPCTAAEGDDISRHYFHRTITISATTTAPLYPETSNIQPRRTI